MEKLFLCEHDGGLRVGYEDEDVAVETVLVDPLVQVGLHVDAGTVDDDHLLAQQPTPLHGPVDLDMRKTSKLNLIQMDVDYHLNSTHRVQLLGAESVAQRGQGGQGLMVLRVGLRGEVSLACVAAFHLTYCIVLCESLFRENMNYEFVIIL